MNLTERLKWGYERLEDRKKLGTPQSRVVGNNPLIDQWCRQSAKVEWQSSKKGSWAFLLEDSFLLLIRWLALDLMRGIGLDGLGLPGNCSSFAQGLLDSLYGPRNLTLGRRVDIRLAG